MLNASLDPLGALSQLDNFTISQLDRSSVIPHPCRGGARGGVGDTL